MSTRRARIVAIRRRHIKLERLGRGRNQLRLVIGPQSFDVGEPMTQKMARWFGIQLAIALNRLLHGD